MGNKCVLIPSLLDATAFICSSISESRYTGVSVSVLTFTALTLLKPVSLVFWMEKRAQPRSCLDLLQSDQLCAWGKPLHSMAKVPCPPPSPSRMSSWPVCRQPCVVVLYFSRLNTFLSLQRIIYRKWEALDARTRPGS